jgi:acyl dehydratase
MPTLLKAALPSIPVVNRLPGIRKTGGDPSLLHEVRSVTVSPEHVRRYAAVCGFPVGDAAPLTFPHVLAFPLHMAVLSSPEFPYPAIGMLHLANTITQHRPVAIGETLQIEVHASELRAHPKGTAVDFLAAARADGEIVWESTSTYLRRGRPDAVSLRDGSSLASTGRATGSTDGQGSVDDHVVPGRITWRLPGDVGRRYAAVSGDHNPIHLHPLTAKAFGFPRQIAHGMWSLARCVAALENRIPDAVTVEASFKKPVLLPGSVSFGQDAVDGGIAFALTSPKNGAPHVVGRTSDSSATR